MKIIKEIFNTEICVGLLTCIAVVMTVLWIRAIDGGTSLGLVLVVLEAALGGHILIKIQQDIYDDRKSVKEWEEHPERWGFPKKEENDDE